MHIKDKVIVGHGRRQRRGPRRSRSRRSAAARRSRPSTSTRRRSRRRPRSRGAGDRLSTHVVNITDKAAVAALPQAVIARFGAVDGLVHCAGDHPAVRPAQGPRRRGDRAGLRGQLVGHAQPDRAFLPVLLDRPEGHIVNVSSMGGFLPVPGQTIYGASKAAVKLLTEGLHAECRGTNVHVTVVFPARVATNITTNSGRRHPDPAASRRREGRRAGPPGRQGGEADPRRDGAERLPGDGRQRRPD